MSNFLQLHLLTSYPPACLNRDDLNRPKSAIMGGVPRLRISSQSLKRAWRASEQFEDALTGHLGTRTKRKGVKIFEKLVTAGIREKEAKEWAQAIAGRFGKLKAKKENEPRNDLEIEQLAHFSPEDEGAIDALADVLIIEGRAPTEPELALLRKQHTAADIALFGRMLADSPAFNTEAACQVAHAITVHRAAVEDDFFTAVDDLNHPEEDAGSAHLGEQGFGAGLFYQYVCIDCDRLRPAARKPRRRCRPRQSDRSGIDRDRRHRRAHRQTEQFRQSRLRLLRPGRKGQSPTPFAVAGLHEAGQGRRHARWRGRRAHHDAR